MRFLVGTAALTVLMGGTAPPAWAQSPSVDEVIAKYYEARGGYDKIKAIQTLRITQTVANPFNSTKMVVLKKRPNLIRWEITPAGQTAALPRAINAEGGWDTQPQGKVVPRPEIVVNQEREIDGDIDLLVDWKQKGHTVTVEGTETIQKTPTIKLKVVTKGGAIREIFLDANTYLPVREAGQISQPPDPRSGKPRFNDHVFTYSDWRDVNGVKFPFAIDEDRTGGPITQSFATWVEKIEVNVPLDDALFASPATDSRQ